MIASIVKNASTKVEREMIAPSARMISLLIMFSPVCCSEFLPCLLVAELPPGLEESGDFSPIIPSQVRVSLDSVTLDKSFHSAHHDVAVLLVIAQVFFPALYASPIRSSSGSLFHAPGIPV